MEKLYTRPGADCGSDHEPLIAKFRLKLKKLGKTTRPFRYDLNQIRYDYTVEVRNRFKGLDLIDREPDELHSYNLALIFTFSDWFLFFLFCFGCAAFLVLVPNLCLLQWKHDIPATGLPRESLMIISLLRNWSGCLCF